MRQASVRAIQAVARALPDGACAEHQETIDRVKALGRRDAIDAELAVEVQALWREMPITDAVVQTVDAQTAAAAGYFVPRLAALAGDKFVPEVEDVLRLTAPTVGRQETRLKEMHGGPLALLEVGGAGDTNIAQAETGDDTLSDRLDAVICAPLAAAPPARPPALPPLIPPPPVAPPRPPQASSPRRLTVEPTPPTLPPTGANTPIRVSPEAFATWAEAQAAAGRHGARACLVISKSDLLQTILPEGFSATRAVWLLRAQLGVDDDEWSAGARALSLLDGRETRERFGRVTRSAPATTTTRGLRSPERRPRPASPTRAPSSPNQDASPPEGARAWLPRSPRSRKNLGDTARRAQATPGVSIGANCRSPFGPPRKPMPRMPDAMAVEEMNEVTSKVKAAGGGEEVGDNGRRGSVGDSRPEQQQVAGEDGDWPVTGAARAGRALGGVRAAGDEGREEGRGREEQTDL